MSGTACKEHDHSPAEIFIGSVLGEKLGKGSALKGCQHSCPHTNTSEDLRNINTVHDSRQHPDLVCLGSVIIFTRTSSPEITATGYDTHFDPTVCQFFNLKCHLSYCFFIKASFFVTSKGFTTQLKQNSLHTSHRLFHFLDLFKEGGRIYFCIAL